jgi:hypothetical protein
VRLRTPGLLLLLSACSTGPEPEESVAADREDVKRALYLQLDGVLARREAIRDAEGEAAARERAELEDLAGKIAERIVRIDPDADFDSLARRLP